MDFSTSTDVLGEILQRLPTSARRRARLVCRLWREAVDERTTEMQSRAKPLLWNTRTAVAYVDDCPSSWTGSTEVWRSSNPGPLSYGDADQQLVGTCNGLLCVCQNAERTGGDITLVNPVTGETLPVPRLPCTDQLFGHPLRRCRRWDKAYSFGYHPTSGRYKLVHVPCRYDGGFSDFDGVCDFDALQVLALGEEAEASWREVPAPDDIRCNLEAGIASIDGTTYWVTEGGAAARVVSLSLDDDERVGTFAMPPAALSAGPNNYRLAEVHGRLGVVVQTSTTGVWVLEEKGAWSRRYSLHSQELTRPHFVFGEDVLTQGGRSLYGHRRKSAWTRDVVTVSDRDQGTLVAGVWGEVCFCRTFAYVPTTEPLGVYAAAKSRSTAAVHGGGLLHQAHGSEPAQLGGLQAPRRTAVAALAPVTLAGVEPEAPIVFVLLLAFFVMLLGFLVAYVHE